MNQIELKYKLLLNQFKFIWIINLLMKLFFLQEYHLIYSLLDCVRFSPALLCGGHTKPLFLIYQLLRLMRHLHDCGLALGDITLSDILISDTLWIQVC